MKMIRNFFSGSENSFGTQPNEPTTVELSGLVGVLQVYLSLRLIESMPAPEFAARKRHRGKY
jgi:hypothetical protein